MLATGVCRSSVDAAPGSFTLKVLPKDLASSRHARSATHDCVIGGARADNQRCCCCCHLSQFRRAPTNNEAETAHSAVTSHPVTSVHKTESNTQVQQTIASVGRARHEVAEEPTFGSGPPRPMTHAVAVVVKHTARNRRSRSARAPARPRARSRELARQRRLQQLLDAAATDAVDEHEAHCVHRRW